MLGHDDKDKGTGPTGVTKRRNRVMSSAIFEARDLFREAFSLRRYGKLDNAFYHAVRFISPKVEKEFTVRRARSIHEGTARRIDSEEMDALREAVRDEARREQIELRNRLASLDAKIAAYETFANSPALAKEGEQAGR